MDITNKSALVTGAAAGIGKGCAIELARAGANLVINDRPGNRTIFDTRDEIVSLGRECHVIEADVFSRRDCEHLINTAIEHIESLDILISNPAYGVRQSFLDFDPKEFEAIVSATLTSGFHISQLTARQMVRQNRGGKIIFISSVQAEMPMEKSIAYGAAKAGLNHMARTISVELSRHRINVNVIEPGWIDTPGERKDFGDAAIHDGEKELPWERLGRPSDIGKAAAFLASDAADYITGATLVVDGGFRFKDCRAERLINPQGSDE